MALSEDERARLAELEALLVEDDPKLAQTLRGASRVSGPRQSASPRDMALGAGGFILGLGLLIGGISWHWSISVIGFVVMALSAALGLGVLRLGGAPKQPQSQRPKRQPVRAGGKDEFMDKLEERWRRRQGH